jgi:ATP-dependent protease ClpP protease subunit
VNRFPIRCKITNDGATARVDVYDDIGGGFFGGVSATDFAGALAGVRGQLEVHINSGGGVVWDGIAIASAIRGHKGRVTTVVDGLAASVASVIAQAGAERVMTPGSMLMIHDAYSALEGNAAEMGKMAQTLDQVSDNLAGEYASRAGGSQSGWRDRMRAETWYTAEEAVAAGLADRVDGRNAVLPQGFDLAAYHMPAQIAASLRTLTVAQEVGVAREQWKATAATVAAASCAELGHQCCQDAAAAQNLLRSIVRDEIRSAVAPVLGADKYNADDRRRMAASGQAMDDGSYPVADAEDLSNAIQAVGRGGADHDAIRKHIMQRAAAIGHSSDIPDNWNSDGSLKTSPDNRSEAQFLAYLAGEIDQLDAGKEQ